MKYAYYRVLGAGVPEGSPTPRYLPDSGPWGGAIGERETCYFRGKRRYGKNDAGEGVLLNHLSPKGLVGLPYLNSKASLTTETHCSRLYSGY